MQAEYVERKDMILRITKKDSMGRTAKQRADMEQNDPKPPKLGDATLAVHAICAQEHSEFPKALYRLALRDGKPAGDIANPDYPLPFDLAAQLGLTDSGFKVIGKTRDSVGNVIVRHPWVTRLVGTVNEDLTIDVEAAKAEEARLRKLGWVDSPSKIKGLPTPPAEREFDPLPDGPGNQTQQATFKEPVRLNTEARQPVATAEAPAMKKPEESNNSNIPIRKSKRGGARPGAGRKKLATVAR